MKQTWQKTMLAVALSAAAGLAFAQQPGTGTNMNTPANEKDSSNIIDRQTQPPAGGSSSTESRSQATGGQGAGASEKTSGEIIDRQTKPGSTSGMRSESATGSSGSGGSAAGGPSEATSGQIIGEQTKPGTGKMDPAQRQGGSR